MMDKTLYHGSSISGLAQLEPRNRYTPRIENDLSPAGVYASDDPGFAAGHSFAWQSADGIGLGYFVEDGQSTLKLHVPVHKRALLEQSVSIYRVAPEGFEMLLHVEPGGRTYRSLGTVKCLEEFHFSSVWNAFTAYGGHIVITP